MSIQMASRGVKKAPPGLKTKATAKMKKAGPKVSKALSYQATPGSTPSTQGKSKGAK